jgi:hypothetical protein
LAGTGSLYVVGSDATSLGLYTVDPTTGSPTLLVNGGPGPGGIGFYEHMMTALDGKLYAVGNTDGAPSSWGLFRLDGSQFTKVASLPDGGGGLAQDNQGLFYTVLSVERFDGSTAHEVWMVDATSGSATLLADGPHGASSVAYDRVRNRLYVADFSANVYYITKGPVPVRRDSWGALKVYYH